MPLREARRPTVRLGIVNSLLGKIAIGLLVASLLPLTVVSVFALRTARGVIETIVSNQLDNMAAEKQTIVERWVAERKADIEVVAASEAVRSLDAQRIAQSLEMVQRQYKVYRRFLVADAAGRTVYSTAGSEAANQSAAPWLREAMEGRRFMSEVHVSDDGAESVFELSAPICGKDGKIIGAVAANVSTSTIVKKVLRCSLGETGECYLVDAYGTFLAHRDGWRILKQNISQSGSFANILDKKEDNSVYRDYRDVRVLGAWRSVAGTPWYVVVEQDEDEAFAAATWLRTNVFGALLLTVVGAIAASGLMALHAAAPIRALQRSVQAIAKAEFDEALAALPAPRSDELGTLRDAFEQMARQLQQWHARLQQRVGVTEAELHRVDEQLNHVMAAASRSEHLSAMGRLAAGVAHEIRTPLTSLKLYLQSIKEEVSINSEQSEDWDVAMREILRIETTINLFLNFARPQEPAMGEIDFRRLADDALMVVQPRAKHQSVRIGTRVAVGLPIVDGDARQLGEAVVNLLVNALEAIPTGGEVELRIGPESVGADGARWVRIDVADDGPGIPESQIEMLFEPFFTTKAAGSGLGLAIVRGTAARHGGMVRVQNAQCGAVFSILLPARGAPASD